MELNSVRSIVEQRLYINIYDYNHKYTNQFWILKQKFWKLYVAIKLNTSTPIASELYHKLFFGKL